MVMGEGLDNIVANSAADSMSRKEVAAHDLLSRLGHYKPKPVELRRDGRGISMTAILHFPIDPSKREEYTYGNPSEGEEQIFCGARYFTEVIAKNGVMADMSVNFQHVLGDHHIRKGHFGCHDGKVYATEDESEVVAPIKFQIGRLPNTASVGALEGTHRAYII